MKPFSSLLIAGILIVGAACAQAAPKPANSPMKAPAKTAGKPVKLTDINVCPMTGEDSKGSDLALNYKNYKVHFCCPGCDTSFEKLSPAEKDKKIVEALKIQKAPKA